MRIRIAPAFVFVPLVLCAAVAGAQTEVPAESLETIPLDLLKRAYLACGRAAADNRLDRGGIMGCSEIYEALKRRAFEGDFERLLAWSRSQEARRTAR